MRIPFCDDHDSKVDFVSIRFIRITAEMSGFTFETDDVK
jgi:hypothetical protein